MTVTAERAWPDELVQRLQLVGEVFASALARKEAEEALRASELMKSAILASLPSGVAVLDRRRGHRGGQRELGAARAEGGGSSAPRAGSTVATWMSVAGGPRGRGPRPREAVVGIEAVLTASRAGFALEYAVAGPAPSRWVAMSVVP